jgi:hypothetical protein
MTESLPPMPTATAQTEADSTARKRPYVKPRLVELGTEHTETAGGGGTETPGFSVGS